MNIRFSTCTYWLPFTEKRNDRLRIKICCWKSIPHNWSFFGVFFGSIVVVDFISAQEYRGEENKLHVSSMSFSVLCYEFLYLIFHTISFYPQFVNLSHCVVSGTDFKYNYHTHTGITWCMVYFCMILITVNVNGNIFATSNNLLFTHLCSWAKNNQKLAPKITSTAAHLHLKPKFVVWQCVFISI